MKTRRLTKKEMWIFAVGQLGWSILSGIINTWLVTFYLPTQSSVDAGAKFYVPTGLVIFGVLTVLGLITFFCRIFVQNFSNDRFFVEIVGEAAFVKIDEFINGSSDGTETE